MNGSELKPGQRVMAPVPSRFLEIGFRRVRDTNELTGTETVQWVPMRVPGPLTLLMARVSTFANGHVVKHGLVWVVLEDDLGRRVLCSVDELVLCGVLEEVGAGA